MAGRTAASLRYAGVLTLASLLALVTLSAVVCRGKTPAGPAATPKETKMSSSSSAWQSLGLSGGGAMYTPAISPVDPKLMMLNCDMSGAYRSTDGGANWQMIHYRQLLGSTSVRPVFPPTDAKTVFAVNGWAGGLKVSHDKGASWQQVPGLPNSISAIAIDPGNPKLMLVGTGEGAFRSTNGGKQWQAVSGLSGWALGFHFDRTSPADPRVCFAATNRSVFRSSDSGATWTEVGGGLPQSRVRAFAGGSDPKTKTCVLYCSVEIRMTGPELSGGVYRSEDRGETWTRAMGEGLPGTVKVGGEGKEGPAQYDYLLTTDANPTVVYAARSEPGMIYRSDTGGRAWKQILYSVKGRQRFNVEPHYIIAETGGWGENISGCGIDPKDPDHVIITDWMCVYITTDGGQSWKCGHTRRADPTGRAGKGQRWINNGLVVTTVWHYDIDPFDYNRHYISYTDIGYARSDDAGKTWYWQHGEPLRNTTYELAFDPETPGKVWGAFADLHDIPNNNVISGRHYWPTAGGGVGISEDHGVTWKDTSSGLPGKPIISVVLDPKSPKGSRTLYASAWEAGVYKSTDDGQTWLKRSDGLGDPNVNMRVCRLLLHPDGTLFCLITGLQKNDVFQPQGVGLYRSKDGAETWECITRSHPLLWPKDFDVDPRDSKVIYLGAADPYGPPQGGLYRTTDGGASWERIAREGGEAFGATINPRKPDWVYMCLTESAPDCALWLSKDAGKTWKPLEGLPFKNAQRVAFDPDDDSIIYVCTFGGSVWKGPAE
jgi:photosystem II stability/assembly factor-like uncharacterized protein